LDGSPPPNSWHLEGREFLVFVVRVVFARWLELLLELGQDMYWIVPVIFSFGNVDVLVLFVWVN
jgi:hypothetical protein